MKGFRAISSPVVLCLPPRTVPLLPGTFWTPASDFESPPPWEVEADGGAERTVAELLALNRLLLDSFELLKARHEQKCALLELSETVIRDSRDFILKLESSHAAQREFFMEIIRRAQASAEHNPASQPEI